MQDKIVIGEILKPQGIRGELKFKPLLDDAALIKKFKKDVHRRRGTQSTVRARRSEMRRTSL